MVICFYSHAESEATRLLAEFDTEPRHWRHSHGLLPAPWAPFEVFRLASTPGQTCAVNRLSMSRDFLHQAKRRWKDLRERSMRDDSAKSCRHSLSGLRKPARSAMTREPQQCPCLLLDPGRSLARQIDRDDANGAEAEERSPSCELPVRRVDSQGRLKPSDWKLCRSLDRLSIARLLVGSGRSYHAATCSF
jgi:hypothetical protein